MPDAPPRRGVGHTASQSESTVWLFAYVSPQLARLEGSRISFVETRQQFVVLLVCELDRSHIFLSNSPGISDLVFRPLDGRCFESFQPDIGEKSCPSPIPVDERVDLYRAMMQPDGLFDEAKTFVFLPCCKVVNEVLQVMFNLVFRNADIQIGHTSLARPVPYFAEHLRM